MIRRGARRVRLHMLNCNLQISRKKTEMERADRVQRQNATCSRIDLMNESDAFQINAGAGGCVCIGSKHQHKQPNVNRGHVKETRH